MDVVVPLTAEQEQARDALERIGFVGAERYVREQHDVARIMARVAYAKAHGLGAGWVRSGGELPVEQAAGRAVEDFGQDDGWHSYQQRLDGGRTPRELRSTWRNARDALRAGSTAAAWGAYYSGLELVEYGDGRAVVAHANAQALDFLQHRLAGNVARALGLARSDVTFRVLDTG